MLFLGSLKTEFLLSFDSECVRIGLRLERIDFLVELPDFRVRSAPSRIGCNNFIERIVTGGYFTSRQLCFNHRPDISQFPSARITQLLGNVFDIVKEA